MPIVLADYTEKKRKFLKNKEGACCLYAIGPKEENPVKVGVTRDIKQRFSLIQTSHWVEMFLHCIIWFPGPPVAYRIEKAIHERFSEKKIRGEWLDITPVVATEAIKATARELYPTVRWEEHDELIDRVARSMGTKEHCRGFMYWEGG